MAVEAVRRSSSGAASAPHTASEVDRELLLQQSVAMLHCQSALALCGVNGATWRLGQDAHEAVTLAPGRGAGSSRKLSSLSMGRSAMGPAQLPVPELLFTDGVQLMSAVRGLQGLAAAARHQHEDSQPAPLLSNLSRGDALGPLQAGGLLPPEDQLGGVLQSADAMLSVHVEEVPIPPPPAPSTRADASTVTPKERTAGADGDGAVVEQALTFAVASVGCLLYTSPSARDRTRSRMPSSA